MTVQQTETEKLIDTIGPTLVTKCQDIARDENRYCYVARSGGMDFVCRDDDLRYGDQVRICVSPDGTVIA